ncbi:MAG: flagellar hook-associated protein FlgL [Syntrophomonadaceae bacterium]|jgi:flagellar hook-associated protein 3 FlgL
MIRITNGMLVNELKYNLNNNYTNMDKYQRQLATGRKINLPSDNPAGLVKSLRLRTNLVEGEQYLANINEGINFMETTDAALDNLTAIMQRIRELAVNAANGTNDDSARRAIADEIKELTDQITIVANTSYGSKYIFAGTNVTQQPCQEDSDPDTFKWTGNNEALQLEIGVGVKLTINLTDSSMNNFFVGNGTDPGVIDFCRELVNDIEAGNLDAVNAALTTADKFIDNLLTARSTIGAKVNRLELQQSRLDSTQISYTSLLSQNEDADIAEVIMNLKMQESVYRASLAAGARIIQPSLVDFLR